MEEAAGPIPGGMTLCYSHAHEKLPWPELFLLHIQICTGHASQHKSPRRRPRSISRGGKNSNKTNQSNKQKEKKKKNPKYHSHSSRKINHLKTKMPFKVQKPSLNVLCTCFNLTILIFALFSH